LFYGFVIVGAGNLVQKAPNDVGDEEESLGIGGGNGIVDN
jgi:hypothetical protein